MNIEIWKTRKKELHLTHDQLAEISGISRRTIAGIFANDKKYASPTLNTIQAIEKALGLNKPNADDSAPLLTDKEKDLLEAFKNMLPETQDFVLRTAQSLQDKQEVKKNV